MKRHQRTNCRKFFDRWKDTTPHRSSRDLPELQVKRHVIRRALFIDDAVPTPDRDAGSNAALQHMLALMRLGYKVTFLPSQNMANIAPYTANLQTLGIECLHAPYYWSVEEVFLKRHVTPDVIYFHRFSNAFRYATLARQNFPKSRLLYNVADLHYLRQQRQMEIEGALNGGMAITKDLELSVMQLVDSVVVHSSAEAEILRQSNPRLRIFMVPWTVVPKRNFRPLKERSGYAFVGGYRHRPNVDAALYHSREIVPLLGKANGWIQGYLVGSDVPVEVAALHSDNLKVLGFIPDLSRFLHGLRCTVAPLRYGAGLKGKILESLAHGIPCVMSEVAAEGADLPKDLEWLVTRSANEFAEKLTEIYENEDLNYRLSESGIRYVTERNSAKIVDRLLAESITP